MSFALTLILFQFVAVIICYRLGREWLIALFGMCWIAVNLTVQVLVIYPVGVSSLGAISYSILYPVLGIIYLRYGMDTARHTVYMGAFMMIFVSLHTFIGINVGPNPDFNAETIAVYQKLFDINFVPYIASLTATASATFLFLVLMKAINARLWLRFLIAFLVSGAANSLIFFPGSLGLEVLNKSEFAESIEVAIKNIQIKVVMGIIYIPLIYLSLWRADE